MALNKISPSTQSKHRARLLAGVTNPSTPPTTIQPGVPVTFGAGNLPAVSLTASGNGTKTITPNVNGVSSLTYANGGVGLAPTEATFAFDGTFEFPVTGATTSTANDVEVFIVAATGALTLTAGTSPVNVHYGWTDYPVGYTKENGRAAVRVGK